MSEIKCACGLAACTNHIRICSEGVWITHCKAPIELLIHLDPNATVRLISDLRAFLITLTEAP